MLPQSVPCRMSESKDHHGDTEQKSQVISLIFFPVSLRLSGYSLLQIVIKDTNFRERMVYYICFRNDWLSGRAHRRMPASTICPRAASEVVDARPPGLRRGQAPPVLGCLTRGPA
jgi:hypothetical protein